MKKSTFKIVIIFVALLATELLLAQNHPPSRRPIGPPGLPIDGGLFALVGIAFGYGIKKLRDRK